MISLTNIDSERRPALQKLVEMDAIRLLLAGMYFLFGVRLTKAEKMHRREQAIVMRKSISAANLVIDTLKKNRAVLDSFTNDHGPSWRARMKALSSVPGICRANIRDLLEMMRQIARRFRLKAGNTIKVLASWFDWNDGLITRAPP